MPQLGGKDLASQLLEERPTLRVLFSSGYTDDALMKLNQVPSGLAFLPKPYSSAELLGKVREILDS